MKASVQKYFKKMFVLIAAICVTFNGVMFSPITTEAATKKVSKVVDITDSDGDLFTSKFKLAGGMYAFCGQCEKASPTVGMELTIKELKSHDNLNKLKKILYYGIDGDGEGALTNTAENWKLMASAVSYAYSGTVHNKYYLSYYNEVIKKDTPDNFTVYVAEPSNSSYQKLLYGVYEPEGSLRLFKSSANEDITEDNTCYSLAGAEYGVYKTKNNAKNNKNILMTLITQDNGKSNVVSLDEGTYFVKELKAPKGFLLDEEIYEVEVKADKTTKLEVVDIPGNDPLVIEITKIAGAGAYVTNVPSLAGTQFTIRYYDGYYTEDNLPSDNKALRTWVIETKAITSNGITKYITRLDDTYKVSGDDLYKINGEVVIPAGTISVEETKPAEGYTLTNGYLQVEGENPKYNNKFVTQITEDSKGDFSLDVGNVFEGVNYILYGGISVQKKDTETNNAQGAATLEGAEFTVRNATGATITTSDGKTYENGQIIKTLITDKNGYAATAKDFLPYGQYEVEEIKAPTGYQNKGTNLKQTVTVSEENVLVSADITYNDVIRGGIGVQKFDTQTGAAHTQGAATLKGAEITIRSLNQNDIVVNGKTYSFGEDIIVLYTDEKGYAKTNDNLLPYGKYEVEETESPEGYLLSGKNLKQTVFVDSQNTIVTLDAEDTVISDDIIRGDFKLTKKEYYSDRSMSDVEFKITSKTTGESHIICTDENGYYSSESEYLPHSDENGLWFGLKQNGENVSVDDSLGALPYDTYIIEELRCEANANTNTDLYSGEFIIDENLTVVDLGVIYNYERSIATSAIDEETNTHYASPDEKVTIIDTVSYKGLVVGETYTISGVLMNKATGEALFDENGNEITGSVSFVPEEREGEVEVKFTFDGSSLAGSSIVVFETLFDVEGNILAEHKDIEDEEQTIHLPSLKTLATDKSDGDKVLANNGPISIVDTVSFTNLMIGETYVVKGVLMDKGTGEPVMINGESISAQTEFIPETTSGTVQVEFLFDASSVNTEAIVVFEQLYRLVVDAESGNIEEQFVIAHEDIEDEGQTLTFEKNVPTKEPDEPKPDTPTTGDSRNIVLWILLFVVSGGLLLVRFLFPKIKKTQ